MLVNIFNGGAFSINLTIIPNTPFSNLTIPLTNNLTSAMGVLLTNSSGFDYSETNNKEFKYIMKKDLSSITITSTNGEITANDKIEIITSGYMNPILI